MNKRKRNRNLEKIKTKITGIELFNTDRIIMYFEYEYSYIFKKEKSGFWNMLLEAKEGDKVILIVKFSQIKAVKFC